jgi:serine/threonine protein kinase
VSDADPSIPKGLADAIMRALARHPSDRFQDMASFAQAISARASSPSPPTTRCPLPRRPARPASMCCVRRSKTTRAPPTSSTRPPAALGPRTPRSAPSPSPNPTAGLSWLPAPSPCSVWLRLWASSWCSVPTRSRPKLVPRRKSLRRQPLPWAQLSPRRNPQRRPQPPSRALQPRWPRPRSRRARPCSWASNQWLCAPVQPSTQPHPSPRLRGLRRSRRPPRIPCTCKAGHVTLAACERPGAAHRSCLLR